ncbi:MAG TPA: hypothetical protein VJR22_03735 [Candidatus Nitrosotalea sp.]|nr:hypothetical protein [Candidatus Nitrosotalea sp.]
MRNILSVTMPEAMIKSIEDISEAKNCSSNTIIKLAVAKFLFDQTLLTPEIHKVDMNEVRTMSKSADVFEEIPLEKIISVQYTLDDGRVIHILRERKSR